MQNKTRYIYEVIGTIAAIIIGIDCAINAWYYLSLMGGVFAGPIPIIFCASAGFILNTLLYKRDFPSACKNLVNTVCLWFSAETYKNLSLSSTLAQIIPEIIALSSATAMGLFTYYSYMSLAIAHITLPWIIMLSVAYFIGVYGLVREACDLQKMLNRVRNIYQQLSTRPWKITLIFIVSALLLTTYIAGTVWTLETIITGATAAIAPLLPVFSTYMPCIGAFFLLGECLFVTDSITETMETFGDTNAQPPFSTTLFGLLALALANAFGNAAIATADSGLVYRAIIGGILSFGVMMQTSFEFVKPPKDGGPSTGQDQSTAWWTPAHHMSTVIIGLLIATWAFMEWAAPVIPLPTLLIFSILITGSLIVGYLASPPIKGLSSDNTPTPQQKPGQGGLAYPSPDSSTGYSPGLRV